jgi:5-methyltetrahydrofolate--homocysteine methyltransferase
MMDSMAIHEAVIRGDEASVEALILEAVAGGTTPRTIIAAQLIPAMEEVGARFERAEFFIPEMLLASRAMQSGLALLSPLMTGQESGLAHRVVMGTVQSDIHDLGKNLVATMLGSAGFEVTDLGADVSPERFVEAVRDLKPHLLGMSSLMTTTMPSMFRTVEALTAAGLRQGVEVMVGGAPLTQRYCEEIGADGYAPDAWSAVKKAKELLGMRER